MNIDDITFMICGPLHACGIENIPYYLSKSINIIYSTWTANTQEEELLLDQVKNLLSEENIIISEYMDVSTFDNTQNVYYQAWSWNQAVNICKTKFCVKMRSDLKFEDIDPLIDAINEHSDKIIAISAFFRPCKVYYCPSDFVIGTLTEDAQEITITLLESLRKQVLHTIPAERKICFSILDQRKLVPTWDEEECKKQMRKLYYIVDVNKLKPTLHWHKIGPFKCFIVGHHDCIDDINNF